MSVKDFANRKYDYLAFQAVENRTDGLREMELYNPSTSGRICTGLQKLAQRWALEFLTERGSMPHKPTRGCDFMTAVRRGLLRSQSDIVAEFVLASLAITQNLRAEEYEGMPDDERFDRALLAGITLQPGYAALRVVIQNRITQQRVIILPIETLP